MQTWHIVRWNEKISGWRQVPGRRYTNKGQAEKVFALYFANCEYHLIMVLPPETLFEAVEEISDYELFENEWGR